MTRLENKYSRYLPNSLVNQINDRAGSGQQLSLDAETWQLMLYANTAYEQSNGLFDITSGILRTAWDFTHSENPKLPTQKILTSLLAQIGWNKLTLHKTSFCLPLPGMQIDFGGIVKEYAADCLNAIIKQHNISSGLVDLAGDMKIIGPHPNGDPWMIGIRNPNQPEQALAQIPMTSGGIASSGDYARCFELDGRRYSHILNPKTGWPISGLAAVSVWAEQCVVAGSIATIAMLKGENAGIQWLHELGVPFISINHELEITQSHVG